MVDFSELKAPNFLANYHQQVDLGRERALAADETAYTRGRQATQDARTAASDQQNNVLFQQAQQDRVVAQGQAAKAAQADRLKTIYQATKGITDPQQFEAMKPQLRALVPDIDGETFDTVQQINQIGAKLFEKPEEFQFENLGNGGVGRAGKTSGKFDVVRPPDPTAAKGKWETRTKADGSSEFVWLAAPTGQPAPSAAPAGPVSSTSPRNSRNNNPGNLRDNGDAWQGKTGTDPSGFVQFDTPENGRRALDRNLEVYGSKHGLNTVSAVISRFAPPGENNTAGYTSFVAQRLGVTPDQPLNMADPKVRSAMADAITTFEGGPSSPSQAAPAAPTATPGVVAGSAPKAPKAVRQLTPQEVATQGLPKGTVAQQDETGKISVVSKPNDRISDTSRQTASYAYRMNGANDTMNNLAGEGIVKPSAQILVSESNGVARLVARNPKDAKFVQAAQEWIMAKLRKESGAAIGAQELQNDLHTYFPEPGDSDELVRQKATSRRRTMVGMLNQAKEAYEDQYGPAPKQIQSKFPSNGPVAPQVGAVVKGFRFKGGDPASPSSWAKAQ